MASSLQPLAASRSINQPTNSSTTNFENSNKRSFNTLFESRNSDVLPWLGVSSFKKIITRKV
jgi:hypothetical protein